MLPTLRDLRLAARALRRSPGYAATAVLSLALGLGLVTTALAVVDTVLHPYTPIPDVERLVSLQVRTNDRMTHVGGLQIHEQLHGRSRTLRGVTTVGLRRTAVHAGTLVWDGAVATVTPEFFDVLGVRPVLGHAFVAGARTPQEAGVVISARLWRRAFPGRERIEGATVTVGDRAYAVAGVMPRGMDFPWGFDLWLLRPPGEAPRLGEGALAWGRLRPGATVEAVRTELATVSAPFLRANADARPRFFVTPERQRGFVQAFHVAMLAATGTVLLIACANLANLTLARGLSRRRELALRLALGASRRALVRHLLAESVLVVLAGAALGMLLAAWGGELLVAFMPPDVPYVGELAPRLGWRVFAASAAIAVLVVAGTGLLPALRASDASLEGSLRDGAGTTTGRTRSRYAGLVVAEVALALALLMAAGLLVRTAHNVASYDFGYDPRPVMSADIRLPAARLRDPAARERVFADLLARAHRTPGVTAAATLHSQRLEARAVIGDQGGRVFTDAAMRVTPDFLRTLGVRVSRGRDFLAGDAGGDAGESVVIVDEATAARLWPHDDPVGRLVAFDDGADAIWHRVVGVVPRFELGMRNPELDPPPIVLVTGGPPAPGDRRLFVRGAPDPAAIGGLQRDLQTGAPGAVVGTLRPHARDLEQLRRMRFFMSALFLLFGGTALVLAGIGQYAVLAFAVNGRMREFGVRMALGAGTRDVFGLVLREGVVLLLAGTAVGGLLAYWVTAALGGFLYGVPPADAWSLVAAEALLAAISLAACAVPALRATRANPVDVLRAS